MAYSKRSLAKDVRHESGGVALYLIGPLEALPPFPGQNRQVAPVRFGVSSDPRDMARQAQGWHWWQVGLIAVWWCRDRQSAERLKATIDTICAEGPAGIRGAWYDYEFGDIVSIVHYAASVASVEIETDPERQARLSQAIEEAMRTGKVRRAYA